VSSPVPSNGSASSSGSRRRSRFRLAGGGSVFGAAFRGAFLAAFLGAAFLGVFAVFARVVAFLALLAFFATVFFFVVGFVFGVAFLAVFLVALAATRRVARFGAAFERFTAFCFNDLRVTDRFFAFFVAIWLSFTFGTGEFDLWGLPDG
jgi:hypothetical protein